MEPTPDTEADELIDEVRERMLAMLRDAPPEQAFRVKLALRFGLDSLFETVDAEFGYRRHPPAAFAADATRVILVNRSNLERFDTTYSPAEWEQEGPRLLAAALNRWATDGGTVALSGNSMRGRGTVITPQTEAGTYTAMAWFAADDNGPIDPV